MEAVITLSILFLLLYIFEPTIDVSDKGYFLFYNWVEGKKKVRKFKKF